MFGIFARKMIQTKNRLVACYICGIITIISDPGREPSSLNLPQEELMQLTEGTQRSEEPVSKRTLKN